MQLQIKSTLYDQKIGENVLEIDFYRCKNAEITVEEILLTPQYLQKV